MSVVLHAVLICLQVCSSGLLPVCPSVHVFPDPSESVLPLEDQESLVVWSSLLADLILHCEELELLLLLCVLPELVIICWVVDGETPSLCCRFACCAHSFVRFKEKSVFQLNLPAAFKCWFVDIFSLRFRNFEL